MGFRPEPRRYNLTFEGDLEGLHVKIGSVSVAQYTEIMSLTLLEMPVEDVIKSQDRLLDLFAEALVEWDLEDADTGEPVPTSKEGVLSQDASLIIRVIAGWREALVSVPPTSKTPSPNGVSETELDLATSSQSLPS
jgi:hypothetical protein